MVEFAKRKYNEAMIFVMQMFRLSVTAAFLGLGLWNIYIGAHKTHEQLKGGLLIAAGAIVAVFGCIELYKTLTRKEG